MSLNNCNCGFFFPEDSSDGHKRWPKEWHNLPALLLNVVACLPLEGQRITLLDSDNELCKLQSLSSSPFLNGASASPKSPRSSGTAYWKPSDQPPATHRHAAEACTFSCTHWPPQEMTRSMVGWAQQSQRCIWAWSQANISSTSQGSTEERSVRELSPQPRIRFLTQANQEARKN